MSPDRAERVAEIVGRVLESEPEKRGALLGSLCQGDPELQAEAESLLKFQERVGDFIETPAYQDVADTLAEPEGELEPGALLAHYRISSLLGAGGMGEVYLAEDLSLGRQVAIKLLKFGLGTASLIRSFHQEERILAGLTHPNIAQLYGGAVTPAGLPYFVMEYVAGTRLDEYCRERQLSMEERLGVFRKICHAVGYAHQHLVVHRDLKPANIRVTAEGEPKLLDFGIAKLLDAGAMAAAEATMTMAAVMTPEYASPEQARGENITTASDVYSLGVILYELLTGQKPFKIENRTPANVAKVLAEKEPTRPSTALARFGDRQHPVFRNQKALRGDLDNIILKALRKEPERRYASVGQFSEDILRHLQGRTVVARKDTVAYRASKFFARNKVAVVAAGLILLAIISGAIVSLRQAQNARRQRDVAQREKLKAEHINSFLQEMLGAAAPDMKGVDVKVIDVLGEASRQAKAASADQPDVMADVLMTLGRTYISLGLYQPATENLRLAIDASRKANGELHPTTAASMTWLGLALVYQDKGDEGESVSRRAVELQRQLHPEGNADLGVALYSLGLCLVGKGADLQPAVQYLQEAGDLIEKFFGANHGYHVANLTALALAKERLGKIDEAESLYRQAIKVGGVVERRYRIFLAQANSYLANLLMNKAAYAEAESCFRQSQAIYQEVMGPDNANLPVVQTSLGRLYFAQGDYSRAETEYRKANESLPRFYPPEHYLVVSNKGALGLTLTRLGNPAEGEPLLREALELRKKTLPPGSYMIPFTESALGECLLAQERHAEAEPILVSSYTALQARFGDDDKRVIEARHRLAQLYDKWGKSDLAAHYR